MTFFLVMFTPYHAIMFAGLFEGGAGVVFQACNEEDSLPKNPIQVKANESKFDINSYLTLIRIILVLYTRFY